ncbi:MAG TPA: chemotaxis protein CheB [Kofleriaceae bacterium]|nr:chemotaxis protein CheB [Kofleriaceae bacterium]
MTLRIVIVEGSPLARSALRQALEAEGDLRVVATAGDGASALPLVKTHAPDVVVVGLEIGAGGLAVVEQIMARAPVPILVVTAPPARDEAALALEALRRGALDVATRPSGPGGNADAIDLRRHVRSLAGLPVVRHVAASRATTPPAIARGNAAAVPLVGVAASAGGPLAVARVLGALPPSFPGCIALVQHLPNGFVAFFAKFLRRHSAFEIVVATEDVVPRPGIVVVAPDDRHLVLTPSRSLSSSSDPPEGHYRPAATVLFRSLAQFAGAGAVGVVLTGIGDDGADGLLAMRRSGATTFAQDAATSTVFGMPRAAIDAGAASEALPLDAIAPALIEAVSRA